jgi:hypothetical protein
VRRIKAATGDHYVEMGVEEHFLIPGMENRCESHLCPQMLPVLCELEQGLSSGPEEHVVEDWTVLEDDWVEFSGHGENHMEVGCREDLGMYLCKPPCALDALALGAVPVATRVV